jgi:DNA-binding Xre family transcriptional regulator
MLNWNIRAICRARGIERPHTFLVKAGITHHSATAILNNDIRSLRFNHLELICEKLNCTPNDLLHWKPRTDHPLPENHQLQQLRNNPTEFDLTEILNALPLHKLNEIKNLLTTSADPNP